MILSKGKYSFSKDSRLLNKRDFDYLKGDARQLRGDGLKVYYRISRPQEVSTGKTRIAFSISRKVGKAVFRNRFRRILKEQFRQSPYTHLNFDALFVIDPFLLKRMPDFAVAENSLRQDFNGLFKRMFERSEALKFKGQ